jgi:hypothetical protein
LQVEQYVPGNRTDVDTIARRRGVGTEKMGNGLGGGTGDNDGLRVVR